VLVVVAAAVVVVTSTGAADTTGVDDSGTAPASGTGTDGGPDIEASFDDPHPTANTATHATKIPRTARINISRPQLSTSIGRRHANLKRFRRDLHHTENLSDV